MISFWKKVEKCYHFYNLLISITILENFINFHNLIILFFENSQIYRYFIILFLYDDPLLEKE